jgi:hypothetical protein
MGRPVPKRLLQAVNPPSDFEAKFLIAEHLKRNNRRRLAAQGIGREDLARVLDPEKRRFWGS